MAFFCVCKGGPMYWADHEVGLPNLLKALQKYHKIYPGSIYFKPSALLKKCVEMGVGVQEYYNKMGKRVANAKL